MARVRFGKYSVSLPANRLVRIGLGVALVILGGVFGFLPVLGYWMVPVGLLILAIDVPPIRRFNRRMTVAVVGWWNNRMSHADRKAARRDAPAEAAGAHRFRLGYSASGPVSPVRMRTAPSSSVMKILPSPMWPVRADCTIAATTSSTRLSSIATSTLVLGR